MNYYNIKKVIYSSEEGNVISEKIINMDKTHISSGWNAFLKFNY